MRGTIVALITTFLITAQAHAATDPLQLMKSMPCAYVHDMLMPVFGNAPSEAFVEKNARLIPPDSWTPMMLQEFETRVRECVSTEGNVMRPFVGGSMLGNYIRAAANSVEARKKKLAQEQSQAQFTAMAQQSRRDAQVNSVDADLKDAEAATTSVDIQQALAKARRDLLDDALSDADRQSFASRVAAADAKLSGSLTSEQAQLDAQTAARRSEAQAEEQELERLQKLNDSKKAQIVADQERQARLDAARREAAELDAQQARTVQPSAPPSPPGTVNEADDCPAIKSHEAELEKMLKKGKEDADKLAGKTPAELALDPGPACGIAAEQILFFKTMLSYTQECPPSSKAGNPHNRDNMAGMVLMLQSQARQMGCH